MTSASSSTSGVNHGRKSSPDPGSIRGQNQRIRLPSSVPIKPPPSAAAFPSPSPQEHAPRPSEKLAGASVTAAAFFFFLASRGTSRGRDPLLPLSLVLALLRDPLVVFFPQSLERNGFTEARRRLRNSGRASPLPEDARVDAVATIESAAPLRTSSSPLEAWGRTRATAAVCLVSGDQKRRPVSSFSSVRSIWCENEEVRIDLIR